MSRITQPPIHDDDSGPSAHDANSPTRPQLRRSLTLPVLTLYGLGTILGAGVYVLIGQVAAEAGLYAPVSFALAAVLAGISGLSFAELSARIPKSAGEAAYVQSAFGSKWAVVVGLAVVLVGATSAATVSVGFAGYLRVLVDVPVAVAVVALIVLLGGTAAWGMKQSVYFAAVLTLIEVVGLLVVLIAAAPSLETLPDRIGELTPGFTGMEWQGILLGGFVAFYAYIGFEDIVNMAEEVKRPERTLPLAIFLSLGTAAILYFLLALVSVLTVPTDVLATSDAPLASVYEAATGSPSTALTIIALFAVSNGALVQIIMGARVLYGLSDRGAIPASIGRIHPRTQTPVRATLLLSAVVMTLAIAFPIGALAQWTTFVTLGIFAVVNLSLWRIKLREPSVPGVRCFPMWVPVSGFFVSAGFMVYRAVRLATGST